MWQETHHETLFEQLVCILWNEMNQNFEKFEGSYIFNEFSVEFIGDVDGSEDCYSEKREWKDEGEDVSAGSWGSASCHYQWTSVSAATTAAAQLVLIAW